MNSPKNWIFSNSCIYESETPMWNRISGTLKEYIWNIYNDKAHFACNNFKNNRSFNNKKLKNKTYNWNIGNFSEIFSKFKIFL